MEPEQVVHSKVGTAIIKIMPMYSSPGVLREYRLQPKVLEDFQGESLWSTIDFVGFFGNKHAERYKTFSEAQEVAKELVDLIESAWK